MSAYALAGIDPATRRCVLVADDQPEEWLRARDQELIAVRVSKDTARQIFDEVVDPCEVAA